MSTDYPDLGPANVANNGKWLRTVAGAYVWVDLPAQDPAMGGDLSGPASAAQIVAGAVGTPELADGAVTIPKLSFDPATQAELDALALVKADATALANEITNRANADSTEVTARIAAITAEANARAAAIVQEQSDRNAAIASGVAPKWNTADALAGDVTGDALHTKVAWVNGHGSGAFTARPSTYTVNDAGKFWLATDEDGGTPYMWSGQAWVKWGRAVGSNVLRPQAQPYNCKPDGVKITDGSYDPASPSKLKRASGAWSTADVGKLIAAECTGQTILTPISIANGSSTLYMTSLVVTIIATGGTWAVSFNGQTTAAQAWNVSAAALQTALEGLSTIGAGHVSVSLAAGVYTITLLAGAPTLDTLLFSTDATLLTNVTNGAPPSAKITKNTWDYGVGRLRIQIPGAGPAGGVLTAWMGGIDPANSNRMALVDANGAAVTASAAVVGNASLLNWNLTTIASIDTTDPSYNAGATPPTSRAVNLTAAFDTTPAALTALEIRYGSDNPNLVTCLNDARAAGQPVDLGAGFYMVNGGVLTTDAANGLMMFGAGKDAAGIWTVALDNSNVGGNLRIAGTSVTARASGTYLRGFQFSCFTANYRNGTTTKTVGSSSGLFLQRLNYLSIHDVLLDRCFGIAYNLQGVSHFMVSQCGSRWSGADSFNCNNANQTGGFDTTDGTFIGNWAEDSGDDMFASNKYIAYGVNVNRIVFVGNRGVRHRNNSLGRGVALVGGDNIVVGDSQFFQTSDAGVLIQATAATNNNNNVTVSTPSTGCRLVFGSGAPANITPGATGTLRTQVMVYNGATGQTWRGEVLSITGGTQLDLEAIAGQATTCPFTGGPFLVQWGLNTDARRFSIGGGSHYIVDNVLSDSSGMNPAGDNTWTAAVAVYAGPTSASKITDVRMTNLTILNAWQNGIYVDAVNTSTGNDLPYSSLVNDVVFEGFSITTTGLSTLTGARPWAGMNVRTGSNIYFRNGKVRDTADQAFLLHSEVGSTNYAGIISVHNVSGSDIGRAYSTGTPLAAAFDASNKTSGFVVEFKDLKLRNPSGTSGGTKYVANYVAGAAPSGSTIRDIQTDVTVGAGNAVQTGLIDETSTRWWIIFNPWLYRGKGAPGDGTGGTNLITGAAMGALYQRSDVAGSTYQNTTGTASGWKALTPTAGIIARPSAWVGQFAASISTSNSIMTFQKAIFAPFDLGVAATFVDIALGYTAVGTGVLRLGLCDSGPTGLPNLFLGGGGTGNGAGAHDFGYIDVTVAASEKNVGTAQFGAALTLQPGRYFRVICWQTLTTTQPTIRTETGEQNGIGNTGATPPAGALAGYTDSGIVLTGAFPADCSGLAGFATLASVPHVLLRTQ